jgi:hypothetical protein
MSETGNPSRPPSPYRWLWNRFDWLFYVLVGLAVPPLIISLIWLNGIGTFGVGSEHLGTAPTIAGLVFSILLWFAFLIFTIIAWVARRRGGRIFATALLIGLGIFLSLYPTLLWGRYLKFTAASILAERSQPVVVAIESFAAAEGRPPYDLGELVPKYFPNIPTTGSRYYPDYTLTVGKDAAGWGNPWVLEIDMFEVLKWDALYYCPRHNCTDVLGHVLPMGDWVFLDE